MPIINSTAKEIHCKIIYCGAEGVGKKSTLSCIHSQSQKIEKIQLAFPKNILLLKLQAGEFFSFQIFFHISHLNQESKQDNQQLFRGTDGIVFIASLNPEERTKNLVAFLEMEELLSHNNQNPFKIPLVLQYNKNDLEAQQSLRQMRVDFNKYNSKDFQSSSLKAIGVLEPLKHVCKLVLSDLKQS